MTEQAKTSEFGLAGWLWLITLAIGCATVIAFALRGLAFILGLF